MYLAAVLLLNFDFIEPFRKMHVPKFPLLKEWAYAGFFFVMSGAIFSHNVLGDFVNEILPSLLLLILTVVSWYFRPSDRKIIVETL